MDEGVHHEIRIFSVAEQQRPPCYQVDLYGGPEHLCGSVTIVPQDMDPTTKATLLRWERDGTALTVMAGKGRVVIAERGGTDGVYGWRADNGGQQG